MAKLTKEDVLYDDLLFFSFFSFIFIIFAFLVDLVTINIRVTAVCNLPKKIRIRSPYSGIE